MKSKGLVINDPCNRCRKPIRNDYDGIYMDCADILGVSELFEKDKKYKENFEKAKKWLDSYKD